MSLELSEWHEWVMQSEIRNMSIECDRVRGINLSQGVCDTVIRDRALFSVPLENRALSLIMAARKKGPEAIYYNAGSCVHPRCITGIEITAQQNAGGQSVRIFRW